MVAAMVGLVRKHAKQYRCLFLFAAFFLWSGATLQHFEWETETSAFPPISSGSSAGIEQPPQANKVAICLVGGLRAFELTGPTIRKYLLDVYDNADLFIHSPIDGDIHKLSVLSGAPHLASVNLFTPTYLNETWIAHEVLNATSAPNGTQGLLQYFNLVEGCWALIEDYEAKLNFKYDWVIRSRVDGFWNRPMPPIESFNASKYHVPYGSDFGGLNDRLGIGTRETSRIALQRMSLLSEIYRHGYRQLNSEESFKAQFTTGNVEVDLRRFPFCVLSKRKYKWPIGPHRVPVASILSDGPLNGAKCRPCTPSLVGHLAWEALNETKDSRAGIGPTDDAKLCNAQFEWEENWEQIFDAATGPEFAKVRQRISSRSLDECIRDMKLFQKQWKFWNAPPAEDLCKGLRAPSESSMNPK